MKFQSILFKYPKVTLRHEEPGCFVDLNLNQVVDAIVLGKEAYDLKPFFYTSLQQADEVLYRQQVMQDIKSSPLHGFIEAFAQKMFYMRHSLTTTQGCPYKLQKERMFLDLVEVYCDAVTALTENLAFISLHSHGFLSFQEYITGYTSSFSFTTLLHETKTLLAELSSLKYCIIINELTVQVRHFQSESDYSETIEQTFEKFKQEQVRNYKMQFEDWPDMNHVEASILDGVATLYPDIFQTLSNYAVKNAGYLDNTLAIFDREVQFYMAYIQYTASLKQAGLQCCYPTILTTEKDVCGCEIFDLALSTKLVKENVPVICNDFYLHGKERVIVITGPNQGGKTTFARTFGQLHYLASIGCPVPGREARLFLFDKLLTHFEKEEDISQHRSKFEDDLYRIHHILEEATINSIIVMNEILSSTSLQDAVFLCKEIMGKIDRLDAICVWVTFIDELITASEKTVSMASTIVPENPTVRTFKVIRKPADGLAYALSIAEKYGVTYHQLLQRIRP